MRITFAMWEDMKERERNQNRRITDLERALKSPKRDGVAYDPGYVNPLDSLLPPMPHPFSMALPTRSTATVDMGAQHELALLMNEVHDLKHDIKQSYAVMYYPANGNYRKECLSVDLSLGEAISFMDKQNKNNPDAPGFFTIEVF